MGTRLAVLFLFACAAFADERLADMDPKVRIAAVPGAPLPALLECLYDRNLSVRDAAIEELRKRKGTHDAVVRYLERPRLRRENFLVAARIGARAAGDSVLRDPKLLDLLDNSHDKALRTLFEHPSWRVRVAIARHKHVRKEAAGAWRETLVAAAAKDPAQAVRYHALYALARKRAPEMRAHLDNPDARLRVLALRGLPKEVDAATVAAVLPSLKHASPPVRAWAAYVLRHDDVEVIKPLAADSDARVRATAVAVLTYMGVFREDTIASMIAEAKRLGLDAPYRERTLRAGGGWIGLYPRVERLARAALLKHKATLIPEIARVAEKTSERELLHALGHLRAGRELRAALAHGDEGVSQCAALCLVAMGIREKKALRVAVLALGSKEFGGDAWDTLDRIAMPRAMKPFLERRYAELERANTTKQADGTEVTELTTEMGHIERLLETLG